ncbi:MAG TPA: alpha/beta hydrolase [Burkholderiales bacterium]|nr:alpha/beta hydrolase [Burkholderiales bacterium]
MGVARFFLGCVALLPGVIHAAATESFVNDIEGRPGTFTRVLVVKPEKAVATVILFAGGNGILNIAPDGSVGNSGNFLVRSRESFAQHHLMTAVIDAPSDRLPSPGLSDFRKSAGHAQDIAAVIAFLRKVANLPVWLVGTSRGTTSAANGAVRLQQGGPDGIVLTSSIVKPDDTGTLVTMALEKITVPALVVHHANDACLTTLFQDLPPVLAKLKLAPIEVHQLTIKGGKPPEPGADPCGPFHYHGYLGIEDAVVARISGWIKSGKP